MKFFLFTKGSAESGAIIVVRLTHRRDRLVFYHVILSEAKNLCGFERSFASLRMTLETIPALAKSLEPFNLREKKGKTRATHRILKG
jgi:hypothetical protein